ncbi:hypothetical protein ACYCFK_09580 [Stutzerimonas stutzeri]
MSIPLISKCDLEQTTVQQLIDTAEQTDSDVFDLVHLTLESGRELILLAVVGDNLDSIGMILDGVRSLREAK